MVMPAPPPVRFEDLGCCSLLAKGECKEVLSRAVAGIQSLATKVAEAVKEIFTDIWNFVKEVGSQTWDWLYDIFYTDKKQLFEQAIEPYRTLPTDAGSSFTKALIQLEKRNCTPEEYQAMGDLDAEGIMLFTRLLVRANIFAEEPPKFFEQIFDLGVKDSFQSVRRQFEELSSANKLMILNHRMLPSDNPPPRVREFYNKIDTIVVESTRGSPPPITTAFSWANWE